MLVPDFPAWVPGPIWGPGEQSPGLRFALTPLLSLPRCPVCPPAPGPAGTWWREHPEPPKPCAGPESAAPSPIAQPHSHQHVAVGEMSPHPESRCGYPGPGGLS